MPPFSMSTAAWESHPFNFRARNGSADATFSSLLLPAVADIANQVAVKKQQLLDRTRTRSWRRRRSHPNPLRTHFPLDKSLKDKKLPAKPPSSRKLSAANCRKESTEVPVVKKRKSSEAQLPTRPVSRKSSVTQLPETEEESKLLWILVDKKRKREVVVVGDSKRLRKSLDEDDRALKSLAKAIAESFAMDSAKELYMEDMKRQKAEGEISEYYNEQDAEMAEPRDLDKEKYFEMSLSSSRISHFLHGGYSSSRSSSKEDSEALINDTGSEDDAESDSDTETEESEDEREDSEDEDASLEEELQVEKTERPPVQKAPTLGEDPFDADELIRILKDLQTELAESSDSEEDSEGEDLEDN